MAGKLCSFVLGVSSHFLLVALSMNGVRLLLVEKRSAEAGAAKLEEELVFLCKDLESKTLDLELQRKEVERLRMEGERVERAELAGANRLRSLAGDLSGEFCFPV